MSRTLITAITLSLAAGITGSLGACASSPAATTEYASGARVDGLATLELQIEVEVLEGKVMVALIKGAEAYENGDPIKQYVAEANKSPLVFTAEDLEPGEYAVRAFHDIDGNGELNMNMMGIPTEPFAFSNNAAGMFGPASFDQAKFDVPAGKTVHKMNIK